MRRKLFILVVLNFLIFGCGGIGEVEETATAVPPTAVEHAVTNTPPLTEPPTADILPTETAEPTVTMMPSPTAIQATATFTPGIVLYGDAAAGTAAPAANLEQPSYAPSACSDRFPCNDDTAAWENRIQLPPGFAASYFAYLEGVQPTSMTFGPDGMLYVAVQSGTIYTVAPDGMAAVYVEGFDTPTGIAFQPGTSRLYVSNRLVNENSGGESQISVVQGGNVSQLFGGIPCCYTFLHAANGITFGPDGFGYVSVGARADHGEILPGNPNAGEQDEMHPWEASILRFSPDGSVIEPYARGLRNSYDMVWDGMGQLFATDNAPDFGPPDELHAVMAGGEHGYPWYDCGQCFSPPEGTEVIPALYEFLPHSAVTGITAYLDDDFPGYYNNLFVVLWSAFADAQRVMRFEPGGTNASTFATGFAAPIDLTVGPDGAMYVADWATGIIFKIEYVGE
jgi:glucose/arabinose dehydrogenase